MNKMKCEHFDEKTETLCDKEAIAEIVLLETYSKHLCEDHLLDEIKDFSHKKTKLQSSL